MNALPKDIPHDFLRCPLHPGYRGGKIGQKIRQRPDRCDFCREIWRTKNGILLMPNVEEEQIRRLDELLKLKIYHVTYIPSGEFPVQIIYHNEPLARLDK